jgi:hypothetical protein
MRPSGMGSFCCLFMIAHRSEKERHRHIGAQFHMRLVTASGR